MATFLSHLPVGCEKLRNSVLAIAEQFELNHDAALFLLIQYGWDEKELVKDLNGKRRIGDSLIRAIPPRPQYLDLFPVECDFCLSSPSVETDCGHHICQPCVSAQISIAVLRKRTLPLCPICEAFFLSPELISQTSSQDVSSQFFLLLQEHMLANEASYIKCEKTGFLLLVLFPQHLLVFLGMRGEAFQERTRRLLNCWTT
ncbi:PREDICTED: uncharacterized protein LOC104786602 [Camelina sativa]|uniref:Uncharacterized protein LOC104786602 n=1 Tax=Camelina sativa TaxID=90675 RepID=A0ABM0Z4K6_CAMSA|nr:PREDICTED: uncharacterized protein LOC104786602 [Camelina sativa]